MMFYRVRDIVISTLNYMANLYRIRIIYFTSLALYFLSRLFIEDDISNYDWIITFPGMMIGGYIIKYVDEDTRNYSLAEHLILYVCFYLVIFILILGSIEILIDKYS